MNEEQGRLKLTLSLELRADLDEVFRAWTDPELARGWFCPDDFTVEEFSSDATVGGKWTSTMASPGGDRYKMRGEYTKVEPPSLLAFTMRTKGKDGDFTNHSDMTVEIAPIGDGSVTMTMVQEGGFDDEESLGQAKAGWESALAKLKGLVEGKGG